MVSCHNNQRAECYRPARWKRSGCGRDVRCARWRRLVERVATAGGKLETLFWPSRRGGRFEWLPRRRGRSLVEGLFGSQSAALHATLRVRPGLPAAWDSAALTVPDGAFRCRRQGLREVCTSTQHLPKRLALKLQTPALADRVQSVTVNGRRAALPSFFERSAGLRVDFAHAQGAQALTRSGCCAVCRLAANCLRRSWRAWPAAARPSCSSPRAT